MRINGKKVVPMIMNANPLEKDIEKAVKVYAHKKGFYARKYNSEGRRSVPDAIFISPSGETFFIEFKRLGRKATTAQLLEHTHIRANGVQVFTIDNIKDGKAVIDYKALT